MTPQETPPTVYKQIELNQTDPDRLSMTKPIAVGTAIGVMAAGAATVGVKIVDKITEPVMTQQRGSYVAPEGVIITGEVTYHGDNTPNPSYIPGSASPGTSMGTSNNPHSPEALTPASNTINTK